MPKLTRAATAATLAAAVLVGAAAPAGAVFTGGMPDQFTPGSWESGTGSGNGFAGGIGGGNWQESQPEQPEQEAPLPQLGGAAAPEQEQEPLPGPPDRLAEASQLGQVAEAAKQAAQAQQQAAQTAAEHPEAAAEAAKASAVVGTKVAQLAAEAAQEAAAEAAAPTNLGVAGEAVSVALEAAQQQAPAEHLLSVSWEEMTGGYEPANTAAVAAWDWLRVHGWRGIPGDGEERLYSPEHPRYAETVLVGELPASVWVFPVLAESDVTAEVGELLRHAGWQPRTPGSLWLLPPEAL